VRAAHRAKYQRNKDAVLARVRATRKVDRAAATAQHRAWVEQNREHLRAYEKARSQRDKEKRLAQVRARRAKWSPEHRAKEAAKVALWREANPEAVRENGRRGQHVRRARKLRRFVEDVESAVVLERSAGLCGICGLPVNPTRFHIDHIIPLSRGGEHSYANTQAAHPRCNRAKGAKLPSELAA
jgi:5-methylcytosine-specific restriction endonuclease McrA